MTIIEKLEYKVTYQNNRSAVLAQGGKARIKQTGQIVEIEDFSEYGLSIVAFRTGGQYYVANKDLEPVSGEI